MTRAPDETTRARGGGLPLLDFGWRMAYRVAFRILTLWWRVRRRPHLGALAAIRVGEHYLLVRPSYRHHWQFPGGGAEPGEDAVEAVVRELDEELALWVDPRELRPVQDSTHWFYGRQDRAIIFAATLLERPVVRIDNREIVAVSYLTASAALDLPLTPHVAEYLTKIAAAQPEARQETHHDFAS